MNTLRIRLPWLACVVISLSAAGLSFAADKAGDPSDSAKKKASSLDDQLLEKLDNALLEGLDDASANKAAAKVEKEKKPAEGDHRAAAPKATALDDDLLGELGGEDVGTPSRPQDPLVAIRRRMKAVESRLAGEKLDDETKGMQKKILDDLAALMQECKKCQGGGSGKAGSKPGKGSQGSQDGKSPATPAPSDTARNSSDKLQNRATEQGQRGSLVNAMKESWGNLPERAREKLSNSNTEAFLPKYELMLEKYFKRLGEVDANER